MKMKVLNHCCVLAVAASLSAPVFAGLSIGDEKTNTGELSVSGFVRAKYQDKSWTDNDHKLTFDAARINVDYKSPKIFGHVEYRCYQFDKLCDFSTLVDAYAGYNINDKHLVQAGIQAVPFGPGRYWESNYYGGVITQIGLEDVHNLGLKYQGKFNTGTKLELGYFPGDGGSYSGPYSDDASRYTTNFVKPENSSLTHLDETDMFIVRVQQDISGLPEGISSNVGASYWSSDIDNKTLGTTGDRQAWALFGNLRYNNLGVTATLGKNEVDNADPVTPQASLMGSFDDNFMVANEGMFYTVDLAYSFKNVGKFSEIEPHFMYSQYAKSEDGFKDSTRHILGVTAYYNNLMFVADYIMGKNDFLIGGPSDSYAQGSADQSEQMLNLQVSYLF
ncbi:hypothetical protein HUN33_18640 [Acinetobacter bereziniae]|uniref:hypothetical protein n=1 Tax=Acinetobacter TaxID=469 RepID=UPI001580AF85|nr:hypothetical protein [Acinetobacter bereziniae]NUF65142.1 hypothetical protein [Acinetobacter bereziniae]NUG09121.1 hypothetical protein [Acinetobacter bereziniae]NUG65841.1 hypothetical protein [Acinetobacter bereziniae]NUG82034.1 hypothetical protein [Acinetobacter bereziniae]